MTREQTLHALFETKLVAILRGIPEDRMTGVAEALIAGGVRVLEFTFEHREPADLDRCAAKIRFAAERFGNELAIGCGTALTEAEIEAAHQAGASLTVMPGTDGDLIRRSRALGMVTMPGAYTPTEVLAAYRAGADIVKLFPAGEMGVSYIKALRAPLSFIPMAAVGGVPPQDVPAYLDAGVCGFGAATQIIPTDAVLNGQYDRIRQRAQAYTDAIRTWDAAHTDKH